MRNAGYWPTDDLCWWWDFLSSVSFCCCCCCYHCRRSQSRYHCFRLRTPYRFGCWLLLLVLLCGSLWFYLRKYEVVSDVYRKKIIVNIILMNKMRMEKLNNEKRCLFVVSQNIQRRFHFNENEYILKQRRKLFRWINIPVF